MFDLTTRNALAETAREAGIDAAALLAIAEVESGGCALFQVAGRMEPAIRFEGHYFDRRLSGRIREQARAGGLSDPVAGKVRNPRLQTERWRLLNRAMEMSRKAALESTSWGIGQVMGAHWAWLGYQTIDELVAEARHSVAGQARLMLRFIEKAGLKDTLQAHDWAGFARRYNGPAFARNRYDSRMAAAFSRWSGSLRERALLA